MLAWLHAILADTPGLPTAGVSALCGVALWLRLEHRLTRLETKVESLEKEK
jgi:hypothetical protein